MTRDVESLPCDVAHILFVDIVGYSLLSMEDQFQWAGELRAIVRNTSAFRQGKAKGGLLCLDLGDGLALVFFGDPTAPLRCAVEIARTTQERLPLRLRMGIHTGPVIRVTDINGRKNVSGSGINMAQRIMGCGDEGHILVSKANAEMLCEFEAWTYCLHELGEHCVKHGVCVRLFNFQLGELGNPFLPTQMLDAYESPRDVACFHRTGEALKGREKTSSRAGNLAPSRRAQIRQMTRSQPSIRLKRLRMIY